MATPEPPPGSGTVTVASQGAAAFVGDVYYLADGRTGDPILGWPPRPPPVGFSRGDARDGDDGPDAFGRTKAQREGDRVLLATNAADAARALRRFRDVCFPSSRMGGDGEAPTASDENDAVASLASAASRNRALGPSAYFPDPAFAARWGEVVNRPCGLSYRACARRRLRRPSDKPLLPHGVVVRSVPFARAYGNLTVGWTNAALAAKRGVAVSASARGDAADALFARGASDLDPDAVLGANPDIAGDGAAEALAPLLTGYEGFLPFAPFEEVTKKGAATARDPSGRRRFPGRLNPWLVDDITTAGTSVASRPDSTRARGESWRAVAARAAGRDAAEALSGPDSKTDVETRRDDDAVVGDEAAARRLRRRCEYRGFDDPFSGSEHELVDRIVAARASDRESVSVGECPRREGSERPPADTPVFSSPLVHVLASGAPAGRGGDATDASADDRVDASRAALSDEERVRDLAHTFPLGVKLAMKDEATGRFTVTSSQMYRPWFFKLEDLREMVRAAIKAEAETRVARNRARRDKTNRALAALLTAVCHTKPNPRLSGFQMPGLGVANRGAGSKGSGGVSGGVHPGGGGDDDEPEDDDDDDPRNEGLGDEDDGSLNDDDLMKEYMREMVKDGTAEDALGAWARDAARAAREARGDVAKGALRKIGDEATDADSASRRWMSNFLKTRADERDTYQQLDVSPAAHFGLVLAVTAFYAWNVARSFCGDALDRAFLKTNLGRWTLVIDTPLADAMEQVEVGSFEGVCCAAVAEAAVYDVARRYDGRARARSAALARARRGVAGAEDAARRAGVAEKTAAVAFARERDALVALELERERRGRKESKGANDAGVVSDEGSSPSVRVAARARRGGGPLRFVPALRRIPVLGERRTGTSAPAATGTRVAERDDEALERDIAAAMRSTSDAHAALLAARDRENACLGAEADARRAFAAAVAEDARDHVEKMRFGEAARDALARAERARRANANDDGAGKKTREEVTNAKQRDDGSNGSNEKEALENDGPSTSIGGDGVFAGRETATTTRASADSAAAPPMFVANLPDGSTLGDGTQATEDGSGARLRGFIGTDSYARLL